MHQEGTSRIQNIMIGLGRISGTSLMQGETKVTMVAGEVMMAAGEVMMVAGDETKAFLYIDECYLMIK